MIRAHWRGKVGVMAEPPAPLPLVEPPAWMADGICTGIGAANWDALEVREQVGTCGQCPVIADCREFGIDTLGCANKAATVVYGGLTPEQIVDAAKARRAGEMPSRRGRIGAEAKTAPSGAETPSQGLTARPQLVLAGGDVAVAHPTENPEHLSRTVAP